MNERPLKDAERRYEDWSDSELVRATTVEKQDYEPSALAVMAGELRHRRRRARIQGPVLLFVIISFVYMLVGLLVSGMGSYFVIFAAALILFGSKRVWFLVLSASIAWIIVVGLVILLVVLDYLWNFL